ncbi:MAG: hypothetical protein WBF33_27250 [Candidatus Nitrosopolaris sp.]
MTSKERISSDRIGFFFGAGASIEFGMPSMIGMATSFTDELSRKGQKKEKQVFDNIYNSLENEYGKAKVDIEAIMSVIIGLKEKRKARGSIGDDLLPVESVINLLDKFEYSEHILNKLENEFKKYIRTKVVILESNKIDLCRNVYSNFFKELCAVTNCSLGEDSNPFKYTANKWTFFTTNYDNIIEDFWANYRGYYLLDLGFKYKEGKKIMNVEGFVENNRDNSYGAMQLVKLHGSVNWIRNRNGEVQEFGYNFSYDDILPRAGSMDFKDDVMIIQ